MEEEYLADRAHSRQLLRLQPDWTERQYAEEVGRSLELGEEVDQAAARSTRGQLRCAPALPVPIKAHPGMSRASSASTATAGRPGAPKVRS